MDNSVLLRAIQEKDKEIVMEMVEKFYQSSAVCHPVAKGILEDSFHAIVEGEKRNAYGFLLYVAENVVGYTYITTMFSCEVGGLCVFLEEIFIKDEFQGKGYGTNALEAILKMYPEAKRFRLEVTASNDGAKKLYENLGFEMLPYEQMVLDVKKKSCGDYVEKVKAIRQDKSVHHNCNQAVMLAFQEEMGMDEAQIQSLGSHFGLGMGRKYTCGAVTGGLMALGAMGYGKAEAQSVMEQFLTEHGSHQCDVLLEARAQGGASCDDLIVAVVEYVGKIHENQEEN